MQVCALNKIPQSCACAVICARAATFRLYFGLLQAEALIFLHCFGFLQAKALKIKIGFWSGGEMFSLRLPELK